MNSSMYEKSSVTQNRNPEHLLNNEQLSCSVDLLFCFLYNSGKAVIISLLALDATKKALSSTDMAL